MWGEGDRRRWEWEGYIIERGIGGNCRAERSFLGDLMDIFILSEEEKGREVEKMEWVGDAPRVWFSDSQPVAPAITMMQRMISEGRDCTPLLLLKKLSQYLVIWNHHFLLLMILWSESVQLGDSSVITVVSAGGLGLEEPLPRLLLIHMSSASVLFWLPLHMMSSLPRASHGLRFLHNGGFEVVTLLRRNAAMTVKVCAWNGYRVPSAIFCWLKHPLLNAVEKSMLLLDRNGQGHIAEEHVGWDTLCPSLENTRSKSSASQINPSETSCHLQTWFFLVIFLIVIAWENKAQTP